MYHNNFRQNNSHFESELKNVSLNFLLEYRPLSIGLGLWYDVIILFKDEPTPAVIMDSQFVVVDSQFVVVDSHFVVVDSQSVVTDSRLCTILALSSFFDLLIHKTQPRFRTRGQCRDVLKTKMIASQKRLACTLVQNFWRF